MITFKDVAVGYQNEAVLKNINFTLPPGSLTALAGPNGCGKTTLLRAAARQLPLLSGGITYGGKELAAFGQKEFARTAAYMPQVRNIPDITVEEMVRHGRFPHLGLMRHLTRRDYDLVEQALDKLGIAAWRDCRLGNLSGGERQLVYLALVLAQESPVLLLDEPTTYLDITHQFKVMQLLQLLAAEGKTILVVLHDLAAALQYCQQIALLARGQLAALVSPEQIYRQQLLGSVLGVQVGRDQEGIYYLKPNTMG
jgi:ABC-type cobalamin/Fe3+-siderophores transport system ATPase subunit